MIDRAKFGGAKCHACEGTISRASFRYVDAHVESVWGVRYGRNYRTDRTRETHYHVGCALQVMPLRLARDLESFEGALPNRATIDRVLELWREAIAEPDEDGARLVLADLLQSMGDPRGELLALQLLNRDPESAEKIDALVEAHQDRWIGRHREVLLAAQFSRGFLARLELSDARNPTGEHDPALGSVEDLLPGTASPERYKAYVRAMTGLRRIEVWDEDTLEAFEHTASPIVHVACAYPTLGLGEGLAELGARFLRACDKHPTLRSLALQVNAFDAVARSPLLKRLTAITLVGRLRDALPIWHQLPRTMTVTITNVAKLPSLVEPPFGNLVLTHAGPGVTVRASGQWVRDGLVANLPGNVSRLEVEGVPEELAGKLWEAARARSIDVAYVQVPPASGIWRHA
jgi:uncharacterized protein (TIGR02996 family)